METIAAKKNILNISDTATCFTGDIKLALDLRDHTLSFIKGHVWVESFKELLKFIVPDRIKFKKIFQSLITPLSTIKFANGIDFTYSPYKNLTLNGLKIPRGFRFDGNI